jgi:hypothetical protein
MAQKIKTPIIFAMSHSIMMQFMTSVENVESKKQIITQWQEMIVSGKIFQLAETQLDVSFTHQIFGNVLGYEYQNANAWNIDIKPRYPNR